MNFIHNQSTQIKSHCMTKSNTRALKMALAMLTSSSESINDIESQPESTENALERVVSALGDRLIDVWGEDGDCPPVEKTHFCIFENSDYGKNTFKLII
eukprot:144846_1